jgi:hypothetical protein
MTRPQIETHAAILTVAPLSSHTAAPSISSLRSRRLLLPTFLLGTALSVSPMAHAATAGTKSGGVSPIATMPVSQNLTVAEA